MNTRPPGLTRLSAFPYPGCYPFDYARQWVQALTQPDERVYDPFCGRGTSLLAACSEGRVAAGADLSPLARLYARAALRPARPARVLRRLDALDLTPPEPTREEWDAWERWHPWLAPRTFGQLLALRRALNPRRGADRDLAALACALLLGKSPTHFSSVAHVASTVSPRQRLRNNYRRGVQPEERDVPSCLRHHIERLAYDLPHSASPIPIFQRNAMLPLPCGDVSLILTSPPYPGAIDFAREHALPLWFLSRWWDTPVRLGHGRSLKAWRDWMVGCIAAWIPSLRLGGHIVLEVGQVQRGAACIDLARYLAEAEPPAGLKLIACERKEHTGPARSNAYAQRSARALCTLILQRTGECALADGHGNSAPSHGAIFV